MQMVGRHDLHAVEILLLLEQLAEIDIAGDAPEVLRAPLLCVVGLDDVLCHVATGPDAGVVASPVGIVEHLSNAVTEPGLVPIDVVRRVLDGIADRRDLHLRHRDPPYQLAQSLRAAPDVRHRDLVARRDVAATTEHVTRHDRERCYSGSGASGGGEELAAIDVVIGCHDAPLGWESERLPGVRFDLPRRICYANSPSPAAEVRHRGETPR